MITTIDPLTDDWRPIPGFEDYDINRAGEVWSNKSGQFMAQFSKGGGSRWVKFNYGGRGYTRSVGKFIDLAFPEFVEPKGVEETKLVVDYIKESLGIELELWQKNKLKKWLKDHKAKKEAV